MKKLTTLIIAATSLFFLPFLVSAQSGAATTLTNIIEVRGFASKDVPPDTAYVSAELQSKNKNVKTAIAENREKVEKLKAALAELGISADDVKNMASTINTETVYPTDEKDKEKIEGYIYTKSYTVTVKKQDLVESVVDALTEAEVARIDSVSPYDETNTSIDFYIEMKGETKQEVRKKVGEILGNVKSSLSNLGIFLKKEMSLKSSSFIPLYAYESAKETKEFSALHQVQVTVRDVDRLQEITAAVLEAGAERISSINIAIENFEGVQKELRKLAYADARKKAEEVAGFSNVALGGVAAVYDYGYKPYPVDITYCCGQGNLGSIRLEMELSVQFKIASPKSSANANKNGK